MIIHSLLSYAHRPRGNERGTSMKGVLLKALMGLYSMVNTLNRARALIVNLLYLDIFFTLGHYLTEVLETAPSSKWLVTDGW